MFLPMSNSEISPTNLFALNGTEKVFQIKMKQKQDWSRFWNSELVKLCCDQLILKMHSFKNFGAT